MKITREQLKKFVNVGLPIGFLVISLLILIIRFPVMSGIVDRQLKSQEQDLLEFKETVHKAEIQAVVRKFEKDTQDQKAKNEQLRQEIAAFR